MTLPKADRNKQLVIKRTKNPKKWTFAALGEFFNIKRETAYKIFRSHTTNKKT